MNILELLLSVSSRHGQVFDLTFGVGKWKLRTPAYDNVEDVRFLPEVLPIQVVSQETGRRIGSIEVELSFPDGVGLVEVGELFRVVKLGELK